MPTLTRLALLLSLTLPSIQAHADLPECLNDLRAEAAGKGVAGAVFDRHTQGLEPDMEVITQLDYQPEFRTPIWDYLAGLVDDERVSDGRAQLVTWQETLNRIEARYGVDAHTVVAVWGVETNFGQTFGKRSIVRSLVTLSCFGRRQSYFSGELIASLQILQAGDVNPAHLVGSWAGAFGHTQFMPSTFLRIAVDQDGDGKRDLVDSIPDALASTANYLKKSGWRSGERWGFEVRLPAGFAAEQAGRRNRKPVSRWVAQGVKRIDGSPIAASDKASAILLPAGAGGPAFMVFKNFDAIYSYNAAESYSLAIAHLADRMQGGSGFVVPWPTDDPGISRAERREVQSLLQAQGYTIGEVDGMIGSLSREAIKDLQRKHGQEANGRAGRRLLQLLRSLPPAVNASAAS